MAPSFNKSFIALPDVTTDLDAHTAWNKFLRHQAQSPVLSEEGSFLRGITYVKDSPYLIKLGWFATWSSGATSIVSDAHIQYLKTVPDRPPVVRTPIVAPEEISNIPAIQHEPPPINKTDGGAFEPPPAVDNASPQELPEQPPSHVLNTEHPTQSFKIDSPLAIKEVEEEKVSSAPKLRISIE